MFILKVFFYLVDFSISCLLRISHIGASLENIWISLFVEFLKGFEYKNKQKSPDFKPPEFDKKF